MQLRKFVTLHKRDRRLLVRAILLLGTIKLGLWLLPFQTLRHLLARMTPANSELQKKDQVYVDIVWAVEVASRYMPSTTRHK